MTNPRTKGELLSQTAKTYIEEEVLRAKYGVIKPFYSRYTDKGNIVEGEAIQMAAEALELGLIWKNEEHFTNDFLTGTPDVNTDDVLLDVKSSWDATTFPFFATEIPTKDYFFQLQGYLELTGKTKALLVYCLVNTPIEMVEDEIRRAHWNAHLLEEDLDLRDEILKRHVFDHIPLNRRVKVFEVEKDEQVITEIKDRVELCREYYNTLYNFL
jgi:predicted phage-related endonuclease